MEALLLATGFYLDRPLLGPFAALALAYFILAYRFPNAAWTLVWLAFPFSIEKVFPGGHALHVPTEPMIFLALVAWGIRGLAGAGARFPRSSLHWPLAALAGATLLSTLLGPYPILGIKAWVITASYVLFAYSYCVMTWKDAGRAMRLAPWIVGSGAAWGIYGTARVIHEGVSLHSGYGTARPFFTEHGAYAAYLAMILPLALLLTLERRGWARAGYALASGTIAVGIILSQTRASWVGLAVVLPLSLALWVWWRRRFRPLALVAGLAIVVLAAVSAIGAGSELKRHVTTIASERDPSNLERLNRWMAAGAMVQARPWLGFGFASYAFVYPEFRRKTLITELAYQHMSPHSEVFRLLAESGMLGFSAAIWLLGAATAVAFQIFRRSTNQHAKLLSLAVLAGLGTYVIHALFRTYIDLEKVAVPLWAAFGAIAAMEREVARVRA